MANPPVDVKESPYCFIFVAEVPGLKNTDVKVQIENDNLLKISGFRKQRESVEHDIKYVRMERQAGKFERKFNLPGNVNMEKISATCEDGLLIVEIPKNPLLEQRRPKNFDVEVKNYIFHKS